MKSFAIGQMNMASPQEQERYHLRILLNHRREMKSFEDLRTVNGRLCSSFHEACVALNLIQNSQEYTRDLHKATDYFAQNSHQVRQLFVTMLLNCQIADQQGLLNEHRDGMIQDFHHQYPDAQDQELDIILLQSLNQMLLQNGTELKKFQALPQLPPGWKLSPQQTTQGLMNQKEVENLINSLNETQKQAYDAIMNSINESNNNNKERSKMPFVDGPGGSGKSYLFRAITETLEQQQKTYLIVGSSKIASLSFKKGATAHSTFQIPISCHNTSTCNINTSSTLAEMTKNAAAILWDEAPMQSKHVLETVVRTLRDVMQINEYFGAKVIVFGGDFWQILPVKKRAQRAQIVSLTMNIATFWKEVTQHTLTANMGLQNQQDQEWKEFG